MVVFDEATLFAPVAGLTHERAATSVTLLDSSHDVGRDVSGIRARRSSPARAGCLGEFALLLLSNRRIGHAVQDLRQVARRDLVAQQFLDVAELFASALSDGALKR